VDEYHVITRGSKKYEIKKRGGERATRVFEDGLELQQYIGWLVLNRPCRIVTHNNNGLGMMEIHCIRFINF